MTDWRDDAECLTSDPEAFFPSARIPLVHVQQIDNAKAICGRCDVAEQCLEYALSTGQEYGIYGGLTEKERRKLARKQGRRITVPITDDEPEETRRGEP
jgi:WhiB family redox-sensing transcriptional regulator